MTYENLALSKAITRALSDEMSACEDVIVLGEDVGKLGGVFRVTDGLYQEFGPQRVLDTPLGESGIIGTSIGMAMSGLRPVPEIQFDGFVFPAFNQITTQLAKIRTRSTGQLSAPVTIRLPYGGAVGAIEHHSESPEAYFAHTPGLRVVVPSSSHDAYWMLRKSIQHPDPVIFMEPKRRYWLKGDVDFSADDYDPFQAAVVREGTDLTLVTYGALVPVALAAAEAAVEDGHDIEVIDLRSISPLDIGTVADSVNKTGRAVIVQEASTFVSVSSELSAAVTEQCFYSLEAPVLRVGGFHMPYPVPRAEEEFLPGIDRILDAIDRSFSY
ncbi:alpha-ketoacid dehydrogenase subunit beta [Rothia sp. CCM 9419]|uniref:alpha-ketoacid dehydrogenase subunit beta n=1 Tax=Rothia sp. CCM 9419 TaxID=3402662 RepID=UPI003AD9BF66